MAAGSQPPRRSPRVGERDRRFLAPPQPQRLRQGIAALSISLRFCGYDRTAPNALQPRHPSRSGSRDGWAWAVRTALLPSPGSEFHYPGLPWRGGPRLQSSMRSPLVVANPRRLSGRGPRRVPGTEAKSEPRGGGHGFRGGSHGGHPPEPLSQARALRWMRRRETPSSG